MTEDFKKAKKALEIDCRAQEVEWQSRSTSFAHRQKDWGEKIQEANKKIEKAETKLKGIEEWADTAKDLGLPVLPEKVDSRKLKLEAEVVKLKAERDELGGHGSQELRVFREAMEGAEAVYKEARQKLDGLLEYEESLKE